MVRSLKPGKQMLVVAGKSESLPLHGCSERGAAGKQSCAGPIGQITYTEELEQQYMPLLMEWPRV